MRALIVDDSTATRFILKSILKEIGFATVEANSGAAALHKLTEDSHFELALVDWNMPEMNGYEFVVAVRQVSTFASLRILMVTSETDVEQITKAIEAGANEYLMKPFTKDAIRDKLQMLGFDVGTHA